MPEAEAFDDFVRARGAALIRSAYLLTGDQHLAEDLVQSALARTYRSWSRLHQTSNAEAYTRRIMYNMQVSWWRRPKPVESLRDTMPEDAVTLGDPSPRIVLRDAVERALRQLTPKQRAVLVLRFFEDRSEAETAMILGVSNGTVKSQTAKAIERLRLVAPELGDLANTRGSGR